MTPTVFIVDDEPLARRRLRDLLRHVPWLESVGEAATPEAAIAAIDDLQPDLVFLDVRLPGRSGLDVLSRVKHRPAVIFTTAHDQFAVPAFDKAQGAPSKVEGLIAGQPTENTMSEGAERPSRHRRSCHLQRDGGISLDRWRTP